MVPSCDQTMRCLARKLKSKKFVSTKQQFWAEFERARRAASLSGLICKAVGASVPVALAIAAGFTTAYESPYIGATQLWLATIGAAAAGAPIAAVGSIASEAKRQRRLIELDMKYNYGPPPWEDTWDQK